MMGQERSQWIILTNTVKSFIMQRKQNMMLLNQRFVLHKLCSYINEIVHRYKESKNMKQSTNKTILSRAMRKPTMWFPTRSDTNRPVHLQKMARTLKFRTKEIEELYYPCSENKDAGQLRSYCEAGLRLCFCICKMLVF